jgi:ribosomal protein S18 acetylase RimI-like enzyme
VGLDWCSGEFEHRQPLSEFICADPPKHIYDPHRGRHHPRPYELIVQGYLRGLRPPLTGTSALLLGLDDDGVACASHFGFDDTGEQFMIWGIATAVRCRRQGHGRELLDHVVGFLRSEKAKHGLDCGVFVRIDPMNEPSRALFAGRGFEYLETYEQHENWGLPL